MRKKVTLRIAISALLGALLITGSCAKEDATNPLLFLTQPGSVGNATPKGGVSILLTDFPLNNSEVTRVLINIQKIEISRTLPDGTEEWLNVVDYGTEGRTFNLLELQNGRSAGLGFFQLEPGTYDQIRLYLNPDNQIEVIENGSPVLKPLKIPSGVQTGIKLVRSFTVTQDGTTEIIVDFNAQQSVSYNNGQGYILKPTIKILSLETKPGASQVISAAKGGELRILNDITISIPPGALSEDTAISVIKSPEPAETTTLNAFYLKNFVLLPEGTTFNKDVEITINYDVGLMDELNRVSGSTVLNENMHNIAYYNPQTKVYESQNTVIDTRRGLATTTTRHFSLWALVMDMDKWGITAVQSDYQAALAEFNSTNIQYWRGKPLNPLLFEKSITEDVSGYCTIFFVKSILKIDDPNISLGGFFFYHACQRHDKCDSHGFATYGYSYSPECANQFSTDIKNICNAIDGIKYPVVKDKCTGLRFNFDVGIGLHYLIDPNNYNSDEPYQLCERYDSPNLLTDKADPGSALNDYYYCRNDLGVNISGLNIPAGDTSTLKVRLSSYERKGGLGAGVDNDFTTNGIHVINRSSARRYKMEITAHPNNHYCHFADGGYTFTKRMPNDGSDIVNITCEPGTVPQSVGNLSGAVKCSQFTFFSDESVALYWGSSGGASTYLITFSLLGDSSLQNIQLYAGPAHITQPFYGLGLPETSTHYIDSWPGKTVRYSVTGYSSSGVPSYPATIDIPLLQLQDIFAADKSNMCYFWPDYNLRGYGPLFP